MARILSNIPRTEEPSSNYPSGRIRNKDNATNPPIQGTPIIEELYGDIIQFFQKLKDIGEITLNDLPDNEENGYQYVQALENWILAVGEAFRAAAISEAADDATNKVTDHNNLGISAHGGIVADDDSRLSNSRTCNGSFDNPSDARTGLGLGDSATKNVGTSSGDVAAGDDSRFTDSREIKLVGGGTLHTKIIDIGIWDMDSDRVKNVDLTSSGIDTTKIRLIEVMIRDDDNVYLNSIDKVVYDGFGTVNEGGSWTLSIDTNTLILDRIPGGQFDSLGYVGSGNRGYAIIQYVD